jgi:hypothetical protein
MGPWTVIVQGEMGPHLPTLGIHQAKGVGLAMNVNTHPERMCHASTSVEKMFIHPGIRTLATSEINSLAVNENLAPVGGVPGSTAPVNQER